ncbi:ABC transporter ATP-binding protein [Oceanobacillus alkalisoli]|uniref:ABC transporter ATP-binding protein n=1 Tax=Oceanobacillus alkalisoli TaxID=2925113 RepID=UPI001F11ADEE|nr:ABC transporter ATP-binding protein [Oceanobacillus alkalisoli]MCF3943805.1 energy-coupling factor transporter ATPase [Oceanobacillus alkalisoli]
MELLSTRNLNFTYPNSSEQALTDINFTVHEGDFVVICGPSGSGKSTLIRLMKQELNLHGTRSGEIYYQETPLEEHNPITLAKDIGMVFQDPENQIVMSNVMDELLFGMENLGFSTNEMRKKTAEIVHYFGFNHLLQQDTSELSGGEKQQINLASVLLLDPKILILDEPTAQLDPIAAKDFMYLLKQLNDELGITIIIVEHRLNELFSLANQIVMLEQGRIKFSQNPRKALSLLAENMTTYLPEASQLYLTFTSSPEISDIPSNVKEAKHWLNGLDITSNQTQQEEQVKPEKPLLELKEIDFSYSKHTKPVLNNLSLTVQDSEWLAILGGNGTGKSTLLKIIAGLLTAQHGKIRYKGKKVKQMNRKFIGYLPQNPKLYFLHETLKDEYDALAEKHGKSETEVQTLVKEFQLEALIDRHPYDLSGGELQRAALVGILIGNPQILLLDEPTKGMDPAFKEEFASIIQTVKHTGVTIIMVTHDVEFAAKHVTRCSMLFQGEVIVTEDTNAFFKDNDYYTTMINRITKDSHVPAVVTVEEAKMSWQMKKVLPSSV